MPVPTELTTTLDRIVGASRKDTRLAGLAAGGSLREGSLDEFSDLDLLVIVEEEHRAAVMEQRHELAAGWGTLLAAFTGEHVGEPRLLICLYDDPLVHVDLNVLTAAELAARTADPVVLWERDDRLTTVLATPPAVAAGLDAQWIEDRFWVWVHYAATKLGRGELFEVVEFLGMLRGQVLAPMARVVHGRPGHGVRKVELVLPELVDELVETVAGHDRDECGRAVVASVRSYRRLRDELPDGPERRTEAERAGVQYLHEVIERAAC